MRVLEIFEQICKIPHGSGNCDEISQWCVDFAKKNGLRFIKDENCNVIIYKDGTSGYENSPVLIMQGHLDMVCQKTEGLDFDFEKDSLNLFRDADFLGAKGTTLGGDDGIAVAIILAILEATDIPHPPIEAVFTTDEEIGMIGACALDMSLLSGKYMLNIDSECLDVVTVSCAGGKDVKIEIPLSRQIVSGAAVELTLTGFQGGHSGVEIDKKRINANSLMGRVLANLKDKCEFGLISIDGGDKTNAITRQTTALLVTQDEEKLIREATILLNVIKNEISAREPSFTYNVIKKDGAEWNAVAKDTADKFIDMLAIIPNGIYEMSAEIDSLVESSQNMGILCTSDDTIKLCISLRSSKSSALDWLEKRLYLYSKLIPSRFSVSGAYPPWEFCENSKLQKIYSECYFEAFGSYPKIEAIHAGLECGLFSASIPGLDCISVGPNMKDIHTTEERLEIPSVEIIFKIILNTLKKLK